MYIVSCKIYMYQLIYELQARYLWRYTIPPSSQYTAAHLDLRFASSDMREVQTRVWCHNQHISSHPALNDNKYSVYVSPDSGNASHISQNRLVYWSTPSSYSHSSLWKAKGSLIVRYTVTMVKSEGRLQRYGHNHLAAYQPSSHSQGRGSNLTWIIFWIHVLPTLHQITHCKHNPVWFSMIFITITPILAWVVSAEIYSHVLGFLLNIFYIHKMDKNNWLWIGSHIMGTWNHYKNNSAIANGSLDCLYRIMM